MNLSIYYQNARSLRQKLENWRLNFLTTTSDIVCITESWLMDGVFDAEVCPRDDYVLFRRDRDYSLSNSSLGGGCFVAINRRLRAQRLEHFETRLDKVEDM